MSASLNPEHVYDRDVIEAREIFDRILSAGGPIVPNAKTFLRSCDHLSGDTILVETGPGGKQHFLVGDFTGHGLCAAIGTLIASQIFRAMVRKSLPTSRIARELDEKIAHLLPTGRFLAAALMTYCPRSQTLEVWNAALPDVYVLREGERVVAKVASSHPPLGILGGRVETSTTTLEFLEGDRVVAMTDGLLEVHDDQGRMIEADWLPEILEAPHGADEWVLDRLVAHHDSLHGRARDDLSILEVRALSRLAIPPDAANDIETPWHFELSLSPGELRAGVSPVPAVLAATASIPEIGEESANVLAMLVTELFVNALDHGILELDSEIKHTEGFEGYLKAREQRLSRLESGRITVRLLQVGYREVEIRMYHNGKGFDPGTVESSLEGNETPSGRGIALIRSFAQSLEYRDAGRTAICHFRAS